MLKLKKSYLVPVLFISYIQGVLKFKKNVFGSCIIHILYTGVLKLKTYLVPVLFTLYTGVLKFKKGIWFLYYSYLIYRVH